MASWDPELGVPSGIISATVYFLPDEGDTDYPPIY